jgi:hypothetical protein
MDRDRVRDSVAGKLSCIGMIPWLFTTSKHAKQVFSPTLDSAQVGTAGWHGTQELHSVVGCGALQWGCRTLVPISLVTMPEQLPSMSFGSLMPVHEHKPSGFLYAGASSYEFEGRRRGM